MLDPHIDANRVGILWGLSPPPNILYKYIEFISNVFRGYARIIKTKITCKHIIFIKV